ncbi:MAG: Uma2 family endonuclease [Chloroflexi bacterium]|nr:Uma2 family endonuclease [Chloroflexota bacterium]
MADERLQRLDEARPRPADDVRADDVHATVLHGRDRAPSGPRRDRIRRLASVFVGQDDDLWIGGDDRLGAHLRERLTGGLGDVFGTELVIEVGDTSIDHDLGPKLRLYASAGIREYWVIDLNRGVLIVHRDPRGEQYGSVREYDRTASVGPLALSDIRLDLGDFLSS